MVHAVGVDGEARVGGEFGLPDHLAEALPLRLAGDRDTEDLAVRTAVGAVRRRVLRAGAEPLRLPAAGEVLADAHGLQRRARLQHRDVDALALAGALAGHEAHQDRLRGVVATGRVQLGEVTVDLVVALGGSGAAGEAGHVLGGRVRAGRVLHRAALAPAGDRAVDDVRVDPGYHVVAHAQPVGHAGPHVDEEDVACLQQLVGDRAILGRLHGQREAALVHVPGDVADRGAVDQRRHPRAEGAPVHVRLLDVDHLRAERAELYGAPRPHHPLREVEDAHPGQRSVTHRAHLRSVSAPGQDARRLESSRVAVRPRPRRA